MLKDWFDAPEQEALAQQVITLIENPVFATAVCARQPRGGLHRRAHRTP